MIEREPVILRDLTVNRLFFNNKREQIIRSDSLFICLSTVTGHFSTWFAHTRAYRPNKIKLSHHRDCYRKAPTLPSVMWRVPLQNQILRDQDISPYPNVSTEMRSKFNAWLFCITVQKLLKPSRHFPFLEDASGRVMIATPPEGGLLPWNSSSTRGWS